MLLDRKKARIERHTKDVDVGYGASPEAAKRENQELSNKLLGKI
jgi:hypothetical protein